MPSVRLRLHPTAWLRRSDGADRHGKVAPFNRVGLHGLERGYSVRHTRVVDMLNHLTTAQINGRLAESPQNLCSSATAPPR